MSSNLLRMAELVNSIFKKDSELNKWKTIMLTQHVEFSSRKMT